MITKPAQHAADAMQIGVTLDNDNAQTIEIDCKSYAVNYVETVAGVEMRSNASAAYGESALLSSMIGWK